MIRPEHSTRVVTAAGSATLSPITGSNVPDMKSSGCEAASLRLSIDFGEKTIIGRCALPSECWRSRWK